jgi:chromosome segregation ATPase
LDHTNIDIAGDRDTWILKYQANEAQRLKEVDYYKSELERERAARVEIEQRRNQEVEDLEQSRTVMYVNVRDLEDARRKILEELDLVSKQREEADHEVERLKEMIRRLKTDYQKQLEDISSQFDALKKQTIELREIEIKFEAERTSYETQLVVLRQKNLELEHQKTYLLDESSKLTEALRDKEEELDDMRTTIKSTELSKFNETEELQSQIMALKQNNVVISSLRTLHRART